MAREPAPLRTSEELDDEHLISPLSSTGLPSAEIKEFPLHNIFSTSGYERVELDHGDVEPVNRKDTVSQPQKMPRSSTDSLGIYPGSMAHNKSSCCQSVSRMPHTSPLNFSSSSNTPPTSNNYLESPNTSDDRLPRGRSDWGTSSKLSHAFKKLRSRGRTGRMTEIPRQNEGVLANDGTVLKDEPTAASPSYPEKKERRASLPSEMDLEQADDGCDDEAFRQKYGEAPSYCSSKHDVKRNWATWIPIIVFILSIYSTVMSGMWLIVSIVQPQWDHRISSNGQLQPSTATLVTALLAKTIELSFVTVFISLLGQMLTRKSFVKRALGGMTLAEITMRNWVLQPGSLMTHCETIPYAGGTVLGALTLTATVMAMFYTTASDAMVAPKLMNSDWQARLLSGPVAASYANVYYMKNTCPDMFSSNPRVPDNDLACMQIQFSGQSHRDLFSFMSTWANIRENGTAVAQKLRDRPTGKHLLYENTTMTAAWIETEYGNVTRNFEKYQRIVNNVTMAMPHPGVYAAATAPENAIMQPVDLAGVGEYTIRAGVVSPSINVMCVNMDMNELAPLVYTQWPNSNVTRTGVGDQLSGPVDWGRSVPVSLDQDGAPEYLNRTVVDEIFRWGPKFERRPPVFSMYPSNYNMVVNSSVVGSDAIYLLAKSYKITNYTLCEMRSWVSPYCSTEFRSSGTAGTSIRAICENPLDRDAYHRSYPPGQEWPGASADWKSVAQAWQLSLDLNGGTRNDNGSNSRQLTQLVLEQPRFVPDLPSLAEALTAFAGSSIVASSIKTPFRHYWAYQSTQLARDKAESFNASLTMQQYTSGHVSDWQKIFYLVLSVVFIMSLGCFILMLSMLKSGFVTDYTEPQNLFALAINSPPSAQLKGSCGAGPEKRDLVVPWRVTYAPSANHYFLEEANDRPWRGKYAGEAVTTGIPAEKDVKGMNYKRLSSGKGWL
ncbi:hypothetical protein E4U42_004087 [Claviceps africana]|uniref:Mcm2 3 5 family protein n=1 Tax=Claviceps africana TaxID=83212 RepID=A0A8K0J5Z4_9HYPO|nr:hypothetical protein E4U42_004087 [Claviceps africana]